MKCAFFEEHSSSCVVYFRFSGTLFPVSMIDGDTQKLQFRSIYKAFINKILVSCIIYTSTWVGR